MAFFICAHTGRKKSKQNTIEPEALKSPTPSIALSGVSGSMKIDDISIQEQLSVFYYGGQTRSASGRRYSHPNQLKWVEEYENQRRASTSSTSPLPGNMMTTSKSNLGSANNLDVMKPDDSPPASPVMMYPVIPPGIQITNTDSDK